MSDEACPAAIAHSAPASRMLAALSVLMAITSTYLHDTLGVAVVLIMGGVAGALSYRAFAGHAQTHVRANTASGHATGDTAGESARPRGSSAQSELNEIRRLVGVGSQLLREINQTTATATLTVTHSCRAAMPAIQDLQAHYRRQSASDHGDASLMEAEAAAISMHLNEVLAAMQFQDIVRQQNEHIQLLLDVVGEHAGAMADSLPATSLPQELARMAEKARHIERQCVMSSQRDAHAGVAANAHGHAALNQAPSVELF